MDRRAVLMSVAGLALISTMAAAQQPSDLDALKAANQAFYTALSARDLKAMESLWANKPYVVNIGPRSKSVAVGYADAVTKKWAVTFDEFSQISVSSSVVQLQSNGKIAWVVGTEKASLQPKSGGDPLTFEAFVTNTFEKQGKHWLMTSHHAQPIPK
jgi:ketosteroid isomerase-like protein